MNRLLSVLTLTLAALIVGMPDPGAAQNAPKRSITQVTGDLYRFQNNFHVSVFLVTDAGVIATDPIDADAARWLKGEIASRFSKDVRYLVYSHDHGDHISGGEVFADTAVVVAHAQAKADIVAMRRATAVPNVTFTDQLVIELGGKTVELSYVGRNHSDSSIVMRFPAERALFAVDFIPVKALAFRDLPDSYFPDWIDSIKKVEAMDFDILVPGHGPNGTKADATAFREYLEALTGQVATHIRAGKSFDEIKALVTLDKYKDWGQYKDWLPLNVEGAYRYLSLNIR